MSSYSELGVDQALPPLFPIGIEPTLQNWEQIRNDFIKRWNGILGKPSFGNFNSILAKDCKLEMLSPTGGEKCQGIGRSVDGAWVSIIHRRHRQPFDTDRFTQQEYTWQASGQGPGPGPHCGELQFHPQ